jgi:hypothetical protein
MKKADTLFAEEEMPQHQLAVVPANPAELIREVIKSGLNSESVGVVERLVALAERQEARQAEKDLKDEQGERTHERCEQLARHH